MYRAQSFGMGLGRKTQIQSNQEGSPRGGKEPSSEGRRKLEEGVNAAERWRMEGGKEKSRRKGKEGMEEEESENKGGTGAENCGSHGTYYYYF